MKNILMFISFVAVPILLFALNKGMGFEEPYIGVISGTAYYTWSMSK